MKVFHRFQHEITGEILDIQYLGNGQYQITPSLIRRIEELSDMSWIPYVVKT